MLIGFLTGVGVQVALGQIAGMLGLESGGHGTLGKLWHNLQHLGEANRYELTIALTVLVVIVGLEKISKKVPGALIAAVGALVASWAFGFDKLVHVVGTVPSGLPLLGLPKVDWNWQVVQTLIPTAFAMFVVILAQSAATPAPLPRATRRLSAKTPTWSAWRWPISGPGCRAPSSSTAAQRKRKSWTVPAVAANCRFW